MNQKSVDYYMDPEDRFVIENYNWAKSFSNFFPGIASKWGIPMWVYYVSRNQGICSMGVRDKDHPILEFYSFNKALQLVGQQGFRTFIKADNEIYEPFQRTEQVEIKQKMIVSAEELEISDLNSKLGIRTNVLYYPLVSGSIPAFIRKLTIENVQDQPVSLEVIDGLPRILPHGIEQEHVKTTARHIEGMMGVESSKGIPLYRLKQSPKDIERIEEIEGGNFYLGLLGNKNGILEDSYIVDPAVIFDEPETYNYPWAFERNSLEDLLSKKQIRENRTPCAFTGIEIELSANEELTLYSVVGNVSDEKELESFAKSLEAEDFLKEKRKKNKEIIERIKNHAFTVSSSTKFDKYCEQSFLDNVIRGGMPLMFETAEDKSAFYLYSRQNGDLERDYHYFVLEPSCLSQGNGHYRSVLQNRRSDTWFFPEVKDLNIVTFLNLIQTDGYNPLVVTGLAYTVEDKEGLEEWLKSLVKNKDLLSKLMEIVSEPFTPGEFIMKLEEEKDEELLNKEKIVRELLLYCRQEDVGELHEGFWIDHWTYNLDLIERFLEIYPEKLEELLIGREVYTFYDNPDVVQPRDRKHVLVGDEIRQYDAVNRDQEKLEMIKNREEEPTKVRTEHGNGVPYKTNLLVKLLSITANKISTLDPEGVGIEMEAGKPGWNDSLNGLPGLLGSSLCETMELKRLCEFLRESLDKINMGEDDSIYLYKELAEFIDNLNEVIQKRLSSEKQNKTLVYWKESNRLKEDYREKTKIGVSGEEKEMTLNEINLFLERCLELISELFEPENREKIQNENGVPYTYFTNQVEDYKPIWEDPESEEPSIGSSGYPLVKAERFSQRPISLFLEGPVHALKVHPELNEKIYESVKQSDIYDRKLNMFKCSESLEDEPSEIGRVRAYSSGWIENESVYLHMEYKWFLEVLRRGLPDKFYQDIKNALIPFLDPEVYGRSILEGGSFIVSSAFPDEVFHGRGFQPRLSGTTCEMLHIWTIMVAGEYPFQLNENGEPVLKLEPMLSGEFFTEETETRQYFDKNGNEKEVEISENSFAFKFLGKTLIVYHNEERKDTFSEEEVEVNSYELEYYDGRVETVDEDKLKPSLAKDVRNGLVKRMDINLT